MKLVDVWLGIAEDGSVGLDCCFAEEEHLCVTLDANGSCSYFITGTAEYGDLSSLGDLRVLLFRLATP